jgi:hypothetical protein
MGGRIFFEERGGAIEEGDVASEASGWSGLIGFVHPT